METAGSLFIDILLKVLNSAPLKEAIEEEIEKQQNPLVGHPFIEWLNDPDDWVIGARFSTACYVEDSVPAVVYLALKYHDDPENALIANNWNYSRTSRQLGIGRTTLWRKVKKYNLKPEMAGSV